MNPVTLFLIFSVSWTGAAVGACLSIGSKASLGLRVFAFLSCCLLMYSTCHWYTTEMLACRATTSTSECFPPEDPDDTGLKYATLPR